MLKKTLNYESHSGKNVTDVLHFNLTKIELLDEMDLIDEVEQIHKMLEGDERQLTRFELKMVLDLVKRMTRISYGVLDGDQFRKREDLYNEFEWSAAYSAFIIDMFEHPEEAMKFIVGILPKDLAKQALDETGIKMPATEDVHLPEPENAGEEKEDPEKKFEDYTREQLLNMSDEQFASLVPNKLHAMTRDQLAVAMQRKAAHDATSE